MKPLPLLCFVLFASSACARPEAAATPPATLACNDLGARLHTSPLSEQSGPIAVGTLTASDLDDYDRDETDVAPNTPVGARMSFGAPMGWTRPWLERWVACYRVNNTHDTTADPLTHQDTAVEVRALKGAFAIDIVSTDRDLAERIQNEAHAYAQTPLLAAQ